MSTNTKTPFKAQFESLQQEVEDQLKNFLSERENFDILQEAMNYSLLAGGKRLRPILLLATAQSLNPSKTPDIIWKAAMAIECIHTYSLIHDDLPAMDNDDLRRGKATCHIKFDEATAILAGDALLSLAFETMSAPGEHISSKLQLQALHLLARASGDRGMVGGQMLDIAADNNKLEPSIEVLKRIHLHKTAALLSVAMEMAVTLSDRQNLLQTVQSLGGKIGLLFQVVDDILDVTSSSEVLGKDAGSDIKNDKLTYVKLLGLEKARAFATELANESRELISELPGEKDFLLGLVDYILKRVN